MISTSKPTIKLEQNRLDDRDLDNFGPINLVVIQPTSFCNLNCDYCYLPDRQIKERISLDLIDPILKTVLTSPFVAHDFTILWHAGEPLTVPISFYDRATSLIKEAEEKYKTQDVQILQSLQTNATLINQAWCDCFKRNQIEVGVSIDGPDFIHNAHRKTYQGRGSHQETMRGISFLQKNEIDFSIVAVLSNESLDYPVEIFDFFLENGIFNVGFNLEETEGVNTNSSLNRSGIEERYRAFMQKFWDLTVESEGALNVREFETICGIAYTGDFLQNTDMNKPFAIVNFDRQGNFSTFDPELLSIKTEEYGDFVFGNVLEDTLLSICETEKFQRIYREMNSGVELCRQTCEYFNLCGGGAGSNKYWENKTFNSTETQACRYRIKVVSDIVLAELEESLGIS